MEQTFESLYNFNQQQTRSIIDLIDSNILANQIIDQSAPFIPYIGIHLNNNIQSSFGHEIYYEFVDEIDKNIFYQNQIIEIKPNSKENMTSQNTFQHNLNNTNLNRSRIFVQTTDSSILPKTIDNAILTQTILPVQYHVDNNMLIPNTIEVNQNQSKSVTPIVYTTDPNAYVSNNITEMQNDILKSNKIQIRCQPRSKFRPRTQNESKNSSHYLRCEDGSELDYPTINIPQAWASQSDANIIEVALVDIAKKPHPYVIDNKSSKNLFHNEPLIWKQNEANILYFRLTNEDFLNGYKCFMIELIKSKQDDVITKQLIRTRQLDQSMLCFTRIYRDDNGKFQRDDASQEYSCIMTEYYGDVFVENVGPRYGPMNGQEMLFINFKGRFVKDDISVIVFDQATNWLEKIEHMMVNGSFIYFLMPAFPHRQMTRANVTIHIYFKKQRIHEFAYLYTNLLDQELSNFNSGINMSMKLNNINHAQYDMLSNTSILPLITQNMSKIKPKKRLNSK